MKPIRQFNTHFSEDNLNKIFEEHVYHSGATGIDNLDPRNFKNQLSEQINILSRKVKSGTYTFSKYKLKLVSKGRGKIPREISIPTVRDRVALRALNDYLSERFSSSLSIELPQNIVKKVKSVLISDKYSAYIKLDVTNFYPSIKHDELLSRLRKRIKNDKAITLIHSSISAPTVNTPGRFVQNSVIGVPQGLAVSNVLAAIYMINIDKSLSELRDVAYFRYVDDILIFCNYVNANSIAHNVIDRFKKIGLAVHDPILSPEKSSICNIGVPLDYLGYRFEVDKVSARKASVDKLKDSIVSIFTSHKYSKYKNDEFLLWRLDLRITGCIFESKSKGWLFFFSEINDEKLLHELDHYVRKLLKRFNVNICPKRFSRALKEITHNRHETKYVPNFDKYSLKQMLALLAKYFPNDVEGKKLKKSEIILLFRKRISKQVKDLLEDVKSFKY